MQVDTSSRAANHYVWSIPLLSAVLLLPFTWFSIELFHTLIELFAIGVAIMSFVVAWNTHSLSGNRMLLFLGCGYFWVGILDLIHTLTFKNIVNLESIDPGLTIEFWMVARFLEAGILLSSAYISATRLKPGQLFLIPTIGGLVAISLIVWNILPDMYHPGTGLTAAKIFSEYLVVVLLLLACALFYRNRAHLGTRTARLLILSCGFTIIAELSFTLYADLSELPLVLGHIFKLFSFWIIYQVLVDASLLDPIESLSRIVESYDSAADETAIVNQQGIIQRANRALRKKAGGIAPQMLVGTHCHDLMHPAGIATDECPLCAAIGNGANLQAYEIKDPESGRWFEANVSGIHLGANYSALIHSIRDISVRKRSELQYQTLNRLYQVLSHTNKAITRLEHTDDLMDAICQIAVEQGGFKMAWIGFIEDQVVSPKYFSGKETGYLKSMQMRIDDSEWSKGPVGISAKSGKVSCVNDVDHDPDFWPWRAAAQARGYAALAAIPILINKRAIAIFTLYSGVPAVFDQPMLDLLSSLSEDLSAALLNIRQRRDKLEAERTVRKLSSAVEQSSVATLMVNDQGDIEYYNASFCRIMGLEYDELLNRKHQVLVSKLWPDEA